MREATIDDAMDEAMAAQALLVGLCLGLQKVSPVLEGIVKIAFEYADQVGEVRALKFGAVGTQADGAGLAKILEELRAATLPDHGEPKGAV